MKKYSLIEVKDASEYHLFKCNSAVNGMKNDQKSLCYEIDKSIFQRFVFYCENENIARVKCAHYGRSVCPECIKALYGKENKDDPKNESTNIEDLRKKK